MRTLYAAAAVLAAGLSTAAAVEIPPPLYTTPAAPSRAVLDPLNLATVWSVRVPVDGPRDGLALIQLLDDQVYVQTRSGLMVVYDAFTGEPTWSVRLAEPYANVFPVAVNSKQAFILSRTSLFALDRRTGKTDFSMELPTVASAGLLADEERVFVPLGGTKLTAYQLPAVAKQQPGGYIPLPPIPSGIGGPTKTTLDGAPPLPSTKDIGEGNFGDSRQTTPSLAVLPSVVPPYRLPRGEIAPSLAVLPSVVPPYRLDNGSNTPSISVVPSVTMVGRLNERRQPFSLRPTWELAPSIRMDESPLMTAESLFQVSTGSTVLGLAKPEKQVIYTFDAPDLVASPPGQYGDTAYFGTEDGTLYAMNMLTGRVLWRAGTGGVVRRRPVATDDDVFASAGLAGLMVVDRKTGLERWRSADAQGFLAVSGRYVYATDKQGKLLVLDRKRGVTLGRLDTRDFVVPFRNDWNDRLFLGAHNGLLVCLRDRDAVKPVMLQAQEARDLVRPPKGARPKPGDKPEEKPAEKPAGKPADEMKKD